MSSSPIGRAAVAAGRPLRLAHRGLHQIEAGVAENSRAALLAAAASDLDGAEFDVRTSADGVPLLLHDETLLRTHGDPRRVAEVPADELIALGLVTLHEVLMQLPLGFLLDVELKGLPQAGLFQVVRELRGDEAHGLLFSSFNLAVLQEVRREAPGWPLWLNVEGELPAAVRAVRSARELDLAGVAVEKGLLATPLADEILTAGLELAAWTLRSRSDRECLTRPGLVAACLEGEAV